MPKQTPLALAIALAALITLGSLGPSEIRDALVMHSAKRVHILGLPPLTPHRLVHFFAFGALSFAGGSYVRESWSRLGCPFLVIGFAILIELAEYLPTDNPFETWDVRDDSLAAVVGWGLSQLISVLRNRLAFYRRRKSI